VTKRKPKRLHKPHGGGGARNPASLANLVRRGSSPGDTRALTHGYKSETLVKDVEKEVRELQDALAEQAPVRDPDGSLPGADIVAVETAARALKRYRHVSAWCDLHGRLDKGNIRPAARYELDAERALHRCLDVLGMNPASRVKLGLDLARTGAAFDLAQRWAQQHDNGGDAA